MRGRSTAGDVPLGGLAVELDHQLIGRACSIRLLHIGPHCLFDGLSQAGETMHNQVSWLRSLPAPAAEAAECEDVTRS